MLAAVAHHQPEGKQTPAPLRSRSIAAPSLLQELRRGLFSPPELLSSTAFPPSFNLLTLPPKSEVDLKDGRLGRWR